MSALTNEPVDVIASRYDGQGYGTFKQALGQVVIEKLAPIQARYKELIENPQYLEGIYKKGAERASKIANETIKEVKEKVGLVK